MINAMLFPMRFRLPLLLLAGMLAPPPASPAAAQPPAPAPAAPAKGQYQNFAVAIYIPVEVVNTFAEPGRLDAEWRRISSQLKVDKVYIEGHRDRVLADDALLETVKQFFLDHGVRAAGGITFTDSPADWSVPLLLLHRSGRPRLCPEGDGARRAPFRRDHPR